MSLAWGNTATMQPSFARAWLYGGPGSGKTTAAACFPKPFYILVHNEDSEVTLRGLDYNYVKVGVPQPGQKAGDPVAVRTDVEQVMDVLLAADMNGTLYRDFGQTIVFDNFSHYNDLLIAELMPLQTGKSKASIGRMDDQKWGMVRSHLLHIRDVLWRLRAHCVFISFSRVISKGGSIVSAGPALQGSAAELLPGSCAQLGYCEVENSQRVCYFKQRGHYPARHRLRGMTEGPIPNTQVWATMAPFLGHSAA